MKKVAVLRANALGDFIFVLPALRAVRETYSKAELVYLGLPWHRDFLVGRGIVDRVEVVPVYSGVRDGLTNPTSEKDEQHFFARMQQEQFDAALQLHGGGKNSNRFLIELGARITVGTATADAPHLDHVIPYIYYQNEILRWLEVVSLIGASTQHIRPALPIRDQDKKLASFLLNKIQLPFAVLHPGASDLRRRWSVAKFAAIGDRLAQQGLTVVVTGTENEAELTNELTQAMKAAVYDTTGQLSLSALVGLLSAATVLIANDTGPLHLAEAIGTPAVGLFWCGNLINSGFMTRQKYRPLISWTIACPLCGTNIAQHAHPFDPLTLECQHLVSFVDEITEAEVWYQVADVCGLRA